ALTSTTSPDRRRLVVDAMNVIGSRPTGWWRDRRGAMAGLVDELAAYAATTGEPVTVVLDSRPFALDAGGVEVRFASPGRDAADDAIVELVASDPEPSALVVATSDRGLVARARELGAGTMSAGALRRRLDELREPRTG
ncbi:MAG: NYN domain-containing protein, partial [Solirubrobacterales bacterium]